MAESAAVAIRDRLEGRKAKPKTKRQQADADEAILREARERWKRCDEAEDAQRKSILAAKKFRTGDQWPEAIKLQRQGAQSLAGTAAQPARPCLTIDRLSQPCRQISNSIKGANFGFDVLPNGFGADDDTAEIFKGYLRRVQVMARAESPIEWAADQAIEGGIGWFRIRTEYADEMPTQDDPKTFFDQELRLERIQNNLSVYDDPGASKPTRSDARFRFITQDLSKDEFEAQFPQADLQGIEDFTATGDMKKWCDKDMVRIAEYWRVTYTEEKWAKQGQQLLRVESFDGYDPALCRVVRRPKVEGYKISATQILERWDWLGSRIPIIPILGEELNVDGETIVRGVITEGMDAQRMINYTYSGAVEIFALGPKSPFIVEEDQLGDYQKQWETANVYNYSYLPYRFKPGVEAPHRETAEAPIQAAVELMRVSEEAVKATTGIYDPGLGNTPTDVKSGRGIQALQGQSDLQSSNYPANVKRALIYAGELMVEIIPKITRPGQLLHILGMDDEPEEVLIGQHYVEHPQTGKPQPVDPQQQSFEQGMLKFYNLTSGRYAVTVDVTKAESTKREEGAAAIADLIPHLPPEMAMVATPDYVANLSFPGAHKMAEKLRKALPPALQDQDPNGQNPQVQQLQQQVQQLQQMIQSKVAEKQAEKQVDQQTTLAKTDKDNQTKLQVVEIQAAASMSNAQAKVDAENFRSYVDALESKLAKQLDLHMQTISDHLTKMHESATQGRDHAHEVRLEQVKHQHAMKEGAQQAATALVQGAQQHQAALEQGAQQAQAASDLSAQQAAQQPTEPA